MSRAQGRRRPMRSGAGGETGAAGPAVTPPGWSFGAVRGRPGGTIDPFVEADVRHRLLYDRARRHGMGGLADALGEQVRFPPREERMAADVRVPAGQWRGDPPEGELTVSPIDVMAGIEPGWVTVVAYRCVPGEPQRWPVTVQVLAAALPAGLVPGQGGVW